MRTATRHATAYALMAPAIVLVGAVLGYPLLWESWISLTNLATTVVGRPLFVGLVNYRRLGGDAEFWRALVTTVVFLVLTSIVKLLLGLGVALLLARPFRGRTAMFLAVFLPWAYPGSVSVIAWYWMLNPPLITSYSVAAATVKQAVDGLLGTGAYAFGAVALFNVWRGSAFTAVFLLAGLNAIPVELFDYARLESGPGWRRFATVTVPLLRPYLALAVFLSLTTAFADLGNVWMLTGGRVVFPVLSTQAYWLGINAGRLAQAAARSLSLVPVLVLALMLLFRWFEPRERRA